MKTIVRRPVRAAKLLGYRHDVPDFLDAGKHRAERDEPRLRGVGNDACQRGLAGAGRAPQDDGLQEIALDGLAQRLPGRKELFLADELVEGPGPHPLGQRSRRLRFGEKLFRKQGVHAILAQPTAGW